MNTVMVKVKLFPAADKLRQIDGYFCVCIYIYIIFKGGLFFNYVPIIFSLFVLHNNTLFVQLRFVAAHSHPAAFELEETKAVETTSFGGPTACMG